MSRHDPLVRVGHLLDHATEAAGVLEYWIIDPLERTATFLVREGDAFVERLPHENIYASRVLDGFEFDVRGFWQRPLPPTMPIVKGLPAQVQLASTAGP